MAAARLTAVNPTGNPGGYGNFKLCVVRTGYPAQAQAFANQVVRQIGPARRWAIRNSPVSIQDLVNRTQGPDPPNGAAQT